MKNQLILGDCLEIMKEIPDKSIDLVILDPPYFKILNNDWDNQWKNEKDYFDWMVKVLSECYRLMKYSASLYLWGVSKNDVFLDVVLYCSRELKLHRLNWIVWCKNTGLTAVKNKFVPSKEDLVFFVKDKKKYFFKAQYLKNWNNETTTWKRYGHCDKDNDGIIYVKDLKIAGEMNRYNDVLEREKKKDDDVWVDKNKKLRFDYWIDVSNMRLKNKHSKFLATKPGKLSEIMINASSNENDTVLIPFVGSGSECISALDFNRKFIGVELNDEYYNEVKRKIKEKIKLLDVEVEYK